VAGPDGVVQVVPCFDASLSPRNLCIVARKVATLRRQGASCLCARWRIHREIESSLCTLLPRDCVALCSCLSLLCFCTCLWLWFFSVSDGEVV
jgi:hypothetical protein